MWRELLYLFNLFFPSLSLSFLWLREMVALSSAVRLYNVLNARNTISSSVPGLDYVCVSLIGARGGMCGKMKWDRQLSNM